MPGPSVINRQAQERQAAATERKTYYLTDPYCTEIHGVEVTDHIRENGIVLTSAEALALVAAGAVSTDKASALAAVDKMKSDHDALLKKREEAAEVAANEKAASDEALMHNLGQTGTVADGTAGRGKPPAPGDGSLSAGEVDTLMSTKPDNAGSSSASSGTWAGEQAAPQPAS